MIIIFFLSNISFGHVKETTQGDVSFIAANYIKTCVKQPLTKGPKMVFKTDCRLMQVKSIAECFKGSILQ